MEGSKEQTECMVCRAKKAIARRGPFKVEERLVKVAVAGGFLLLGYLLWRLEEGVSHLETTLDQRFSRLDDALQNSEVNLDKRLACLIRKVVG